MIGTGRKAVGIELNLTTWTREIVVCTNREDAQLDEYLEGKLAQLGIPVIEAPIQRIHFREGDLRSLHFATGDTLGCEKIFFSIGQYPADDLGAQLGCDRDEDGHIVIDDRNRTSIYNVFAAGDITPGPQLGIAAAAEGSIAALAIHRSLVPDERKLEKPDSGGALRAARSGNRSAEEILSRRYVTPPAARSTRR